MRPLQAVASVHLDRNLVEVRAEGHAAPEAVAAAQEAFRAESGFALRLRGLQGQEAQEAGPPPAAAAGAMRAEQNRPPREVVGRHRAGNISSERTSSSSTGPRTYMSLTCVAAP
jgi:hypothetical protein